MGFPGRVSDVRGRNGLRLRRGGVRRRNGRPPVPGSARRESLFTRVGEWLEGTARTWLRRDGVLAVLLALLSLIWSAVAIGNGPAVSRYDEWTYIDYSRKIADGHVPVRGEKLATASLEDWSCRGMEGRIRGVAPPPCKAAEAGRNPAKWPLKGENYNGFHPPLYFAAAGYGGKAVAAVAGTGFVTGARWISALFVAGGVAALFLAIRAWKASRVGAFGGALLGLATPAVAASAAIVHNDAVTLLAGAAAVWAGARIFVHHRLGWGAPAALTAAIACTRVMSLAAMVTVTIVVALAALAPERFGLCREGCVRRQVRRRLVRVVLANALATAGPYLAWTAWQNARTPAGYIPAISGLSTASVDENGLRYVLPSILDAYGLTDPRTDFYFQPGIKSGTTFLWADLLYVFYSLLPVVALIGLWHSRQRRAVALATGGGPAVAAGIVQARELATSASYFRTVSGRYAVSIAALYCAAASLIADRPRWRWGLVGFAVAGYLLLMLGVVGASSLEEVNEDLRR